MHSRFISFIIEFGVVLLILFVANSSIAQSKPNIIVFLVDDMGWQDCSLPFDKQISELNKRYHTPNMERMAANGMKFTQAYSNPVCTPTRVSLMTGLNAARHRVTNWTDVHKDNPTDEKDDLLSPPNWNYNGFDPISNTNNTIHVSALPQILKDNGYYTIHVGKAHFASTGTPGADPLNLGFMVNVAGRAQGHPASYLGEKNYGNPADGSYSTHGVQGLSAYQGSDVFLTEALTREAIKAIDEPIKEKKPFFLYLAHYAIHVPLDPDKRYLDKYLAKGLDMTEAKYAALIEGMDKSLGDIMDHVQTKGLSKNTLIIFMSDNGGLSLSPTRSGKAHTQNLPLRAGKGSVYEGGIRVPMIALWPGKIHASSVEASPLIIEDFFPTILDAAGVERSMYRDQIDGFSFLSNMNGHPKVDPKRVFIWHYPHKWINDDGPGINFHSAIRQGKWKLVRSWKTGKEELYNLEKDLGEQLDLSATFPDKAKAMSVLLDEKLNGAMAQLPVRKEKW